MTHYSALLFLLLLFLLQHSYASISPADRCVVLKNDVFSHCSTSKSSYKTELNEMKDVCIDGDFINDKVCNKTYKITYLRRQLFTLKILTHFRKSIQGCCGNCTGHKIAYTITKLEEINKTILAESDIIFPLLATKATKRLYGFHYIPVVEVPSAYYITLRITQKEKMTSLLMGVFNTWPLIIICLLLALISGFVIWALEKRENFEEFPKPIVGGIAEGFWWSFVSMTTVGYGDKVPKTLFGRIFSVCWVLIGITIFALLTGSLTNEIVGIQTQPTPEILGQSVGGLKHKFHESTMVAQHGGFFDAIEFDDTIIGIMTLIEKLERGEINGFLISRVSYYFFSSLVNKARYKEQLKVYNTIKDNLILTEKDYVSEKLTLGIMIKGTADYEYFRSYFEDNWLQTQNCLQFSLSAKKDRVSTKASDGYLQGLFLPAFYAILVIIGFILIFLASKVIYKRYVKEEGDDGNGAKNVENVSLNENKASI